MNSSLEKGIQLHKEGNQDDALKHYLVSWKETPSVDAAYLIGLVYYEIGQYSYSKDWLIKSSQFDAKKAQSYSLLGDVLHDEGNLDAAISSYQNAIGANSCFHQAYYGIGKTLLKQGDLAEALKNFHKAVYFAPTKELYWVAFLQVLKLTGKTNEAVAIIDHAISHCPNSELLKKVQAELRSSANEAKPDLCEFRHFMDNGDREKAKLAIEGIIRRFPNDRSSLFTYANFLVDENKYLDALVPLKKLLYLNESDPLTLLLMGRCQAELGKFDEALVSLDEAQKNDSDNVNILLLKGIVQKELGHIDDAISSFIHAYGIDSDDIRVLYNMGNALSIQKRYREAFEIFNQIIIKDDTQVTAYQGASTAAYYIKRENDQHHLRRSFLACRKAFTLDPENAYTKMNLGCLLFDMVLIERGLSFIEEGFKFVSDDQSLFSSFVFHSNYSSIRSPEDIAALHKEWSSRYEDPCYVDPGTVSWENSKDPNRTLRVGILSGDLRYHPVAYFLEPFVRSLDKGKFELVIFSTLPEQNKDDMSARFLAHCSDWFDIEKLSNSEIVEKVRNNKVDIMIDMSGHTTNQRLQALAGRMAPLQVEWLGYPNTTGMRSIDYRITDDITEPEGDADAYSSEKLIRLPYGFHVYRPFYRYPSVSQCPWVQEGHITFGSFNNVRKVTSEVIALWAKILKRTPNSILLLKDRNLDYKENRDRILSLFVLNGVSTRRIKLMGKLKTNANHLNAYSLIDIALDPFPYNGTTTTCEALYMGVPVITLLGNRHAARVTSSILIHMGRPEWVAHNEDEYVSLAAGLASEPQKLVDYRKSQREKIEESPLGDEERFTSDMQNALRDIWVKWCNKEENLEERKNHVKQFK